MKIKRILLNATMALMLALAGGAVISQAPVYAGSPSGGGGAGGGGGGAGGGGGGGGAGGGGGGGGGASTACPSNNTAKGQVLEGLGQTGSNCDDSQVDKTIKTVVNILSTVVGIASVIVIIISGLKYVLSAGSQEKVSSAKGTLIYALVGLAVAALTQLLIHFVLFQTDK